MIWHLRVKSPKTGVGRHALPTKSGSLLPVALYLFLPELRPRTCGHRVQRGTKPDWRISTLVRSASLRTTRFGSCFILVFHPASPGGGFQRRGPRPPAFVSFQGGRGEIEIPPRFSLGGPGGTFSFQKRISPLASAGNLGPLREQEPAKGHPGSAAYSCTGGRPGPGSARRWGWRGCGCPPPPRSGW